jgi:hypothetical protein
MKTNVCEAILIQQLEQQPEQQQPEQQQQQRHINAPIPSLDSSQLT